MNFAGILNKCLSKGVRAGQGALVEYPSQAVLINAGSAIRCEIKCCPGRNRSYSD